MLNVRRTRLSTVSDRAFPFAAARTWNSLPYHAMDQFIVHHVVNLGHRLSLFTPYSEFRSYLLTVHRVILITHCIYCAPCVEFRSYTKSKIIVHRAVNLHHTLRLLCNM